MALQHHIYFHCILVFCFSMRSFLRKRISTEAYQGHINTSLFFNLHTFFCKIYTFFCKFYTFFCKFYTFFCKFCTFFCKIYTFSCKIYTFFCKIYTFFCKFYTFFCNFFLNDYYFSGLLLSCQHKIIYGVCYIEYDYANMKKKNYLKLSLLLKIS